MDTESPADTTKRSGDGDRDPAPGRSSVGRREFLAAVGSVGAVAAAGCGIASSRTTLTDPRVHTDAPGRRSLHFADDGTEIASFGADGAVSSGWVTLDTELWHREGTWVDTIRLRFWMPDAGDAPTQTALTSPVEGDSSPPPSLSLHSPDRAPGTVVEVTDLDDLADETISQLGFIVRPFSETATTVAIDATIELSTDGWFSGGYTLDGRLDLTYPELANE